MYLKCKTVRVTLIQLVRTRHNFSVCHYIQSYKLSRLLLGTSLLWDLSTTIIWLNVTIISMPWVMCCARNPMEFPAAVKRVVATRILLKDFAWTHSTRVGLIIILAHVWEFQVHL